MHISLCSINILAIVHFAETLAETLLQKKAPRESKAVDAKVKPEGKSVPKCENGETKMDTSNASKPPIQTENTVSTTTEIRPEPETIVTPGAAAASATPTKPNKQKKGKQN